MSRYCKKDRLETHIFIVAKHHGPLRKCQVLQREEGEPIGSYLVVTDGMNIPVDMPNEIPTARLLDVQYGVGGAVPFGRRSVSPSGGRLGPQISPAAHMNTD